MRPKQQAEIIQAPTITFQKKVKQKILFMEMNLSKHKQKLNFF